MTNREVDIEGRKEETRVGTGRKKDEKTFD